MIGIKGKDYLDAVWDIANSRGCSCENDYAFSQDVLGMVRCERCNTVVITQKEIDKMEDNNELPKPNITNKYLRRSVGYDFK